MNARFFGLLTLTVCCRIDAAEPRRHDQPPAALPSPLAARIVDAAVAEHRQFNGHRINADGYLWQFGLAESESEPLHDLEDGHAEDNQSGRFAWRRVWEYWLTLDRYVPGQALSRKLVSISGLIDAAQEPGDYQETELGDVLAQTGETEGAAGTAIRQAAVRAAMVDSPWSAVFIAHIMHRAGLNESQFRYASAHWRYIREAFVADEKSGYAYRARDPRKTVAKPGDLLCYARGASPLRNFGEWRSAVQAPGFSIGSHCEVVVRVDLDAAKLETISGNVMHSVARRQLKLNAANLLSDSHHPDTAKPRGTTACRPDLPCRTNNFNTQYWSVLLQLKS